MERQRKTWDGRLKEAIMWRGEGGETAEAADLAVDERRRQRRRQRQRQRRRLISRGRTFLCPILEAEQKQKQPLDGSLALLLSAWKATS